MTQQNTDAARRLEQEAVELDPELSAEEKATRLKDAAAAQAAESEAKENADLDSAASAPTSASPGVAEHEQEMGRRGFEKAGPPA